MNSRILHYEFVTGESVNITVSAEIAEIIYDSRRMEHASNERSRYRRAAGHYRHHLCYRADCVVEQQLVHSGGYQGRQPAE